MILQRSQFVHQLPVGEGRILIIHAITHFRLPVDNDLNLLVNYFAVPRRVPDDCAALTELLPFAPEVIQDALKALLERGILTEKSPEQELADISAELAPMHGRDPGEILELYRRKMREGAAPYWSVETAYGAGDFGAAGTRIDVLLFGDCDIQMEADFLRREAAQRGIDLHVSTTFPDDFRFASDHKHDAIIIGALRARSTIAEQSSPEQGPHSLYIAQVQHLLQQLRERSDAPILIDNLPEPTVQPLGLAERGAAGHRSRFRLANVTLAELVSKIPDVHVVDVAAALNAIGLERMLDDGLLGFTHFGSIGWLLQRPESEMAAVHGIFPDTAPLLQTVDGDPYGREKALAVTHIDALISALGIGQKKCVIVDLDGTLWPGVLAETGSPFAWTPEISGAFSYIGLYFGLHEALLCLKKRGILLACASKNDEATVRELWRYPDNYPRNRLLTPDDFVTWRINWNDKVGNIRSIADELGLALDSFLYIDDHPVERDRVRQRLPEVEVWGEDPFSLRRRLLNDPRLQPTSITEEAAARSVLVKAQLDRQHLRTEMMDESDYIASLQIRCRFDTLDSASTRLARVEELFRRTTQFNTTGRKFSLEQLKDLAGNPSAAVFTLEVSDRFGDHGLVGAAILSAGEILGLAISCRVLGMGVEHQFLHYILAEAKKSLSEIKGQIISTPRNIPVRNIYRDNGFSEKEPGLWVHSF